MLVAATPIAGFIERNPTVVMLALAFLLVIGMALIADGFGVHVPKGYIYAAMAFSALVEGLNLLSRRARRGRAREPAPNPSPWPSKARPPSRSVDDRLVGEGAQHPAIIGPARTGRLRHQHADELLLRVEPSGCPDANA